VQYIFFLILFSECALV